MATSCALSQRSPPAEMAAPLAQSGRVEITLDTTDGRYDRQELITWWDQQRLREARVLVIGAGALGNELVKNLALLGVGNVVVVDLDAVENSNLSRCVLFSETDEGKPKAQVVAAAARRLNPEIRVTPVVGDVRLVTGLAAFQEADVVLGGLDNREARLHINQSCWKVGTPWVDGAIEGLMGVMRSFVPPASACYECTLGDRDYELLAARRACSLLTRDEMVGGKIPTVATTGSIIAGMQVQEAVKLLHVDCLEYGFAGRGFVYNGLTHDSYAVSYARRDECLSHDTYDLEDVPRYAAETTFGVLLASAQEALGPDAVLEPEHEIVRSMRCGQCGAQQSYNRVALSLTVRDARCPSCGGERSLALAHRIDGSEEGLLDATPASVGFPPHDIITARSGAQRRHFLLSDSDNWLWGKRL